MYAIRSYYDLSISALRDYIFIYLYMTGPVRYILNLAPELFNIKFSWDRINDVLDSMSDIRTINKNKDRITSYNVCYTKLLRHRSEKVS